MVEAIIKVSKRFIVEFTECLPLTLTEYCNSSGIVIWHKEKPPPAALAWIKQASPPCLPAASSPGGAGSEYLTPMGSNHPRADRHLSQTQPLPVLLLCLCSFSSLLSQSRVRLQHHEHCCKLTASPALNCLSGPGNGMRSHTGIVALPSQTKAAPRQAGFFS